MTKSLGIILVLIATSGCSTWNALLARTADQDEPLPESGKLSSDELTRKLCVALTSVGEQNYALSPGYKRCSSEAADAFSTTPARNDYHRTSAVCSGTAAGANAEEQSRSRVHCYTTSVALLNQQALKEAAAQCESAGSKSLTDQNQCFKQVFEEMDQLAAKGEAP